MDINTSDVIQLTVALNEQGAGDNVNVELDNKDGKYDDLIDRDTRFNKTWKIYGGYNGETVSVFTGKHFFLRKNSSSTISGDFLARDNYAAKAPIISEFISNMNIVDIVEYIYTKYLGYTAGEISSSGDWSGSEHTIEFLEFKNESPVDKLKEIVESFGGSLYNTSDGKIKVDKNFTNQTVDFTYDTDHIISWSKEVSAVEDLTNELEIIGREKDIKTMLGDTEKVLNYSSLNPGQLGYPYIDTVYRRHRDEFLREYKGTDYIPAGTEDNISLRTGNSDFGLKYTAGESREYTIQKISNKDLKSIPTDIEIKELNWDDSWGEKWSSETSSYNIDILGWNEEEIYVRIGGDKIKPTGGIIDNKRIIVYGNAIDSRYVVNKGQVYDGRRIFDVYHEFDQNFLTRFYTNKHLIDPYTGNRMSDYSGVNKRLTKNLDWVNSDDQAEFIANRLFEAEMVKQNKFSVTVPFNPLIERGDLIEVETKDDTITFWVNSIKHHMGTAMTSEFSGYIYNSNLISWGTYIGTDGWS